MFPLIERCNIHYMLKVVAYQWHCNATLVAQLGHYSVTTMSQSSWNLFLLYLFITIRRR